MKVVMADLLAQALNDPVNGTTGESPITFTGSISASGVVLPDRKDPSDILLCRG